MISNAWALKWSLLYRDSIAEAAQITDSIRTRFKIPDFNLFASFRVRCTAWTVGTATAKLRFGFTNAESDISPLGINFIALPAVAASDYRSVVYDIASASPNVVGNPLSILPPNVSYLLTTAVGATTMTIEIYGAMLAVA